MTIYEIRRGASDLEILGGEPDTLTRLTVLSISNSDGGRCGIVLEIDGLASVHEAIGRRLAALRARA